MGILQPAWIWQQLYKMSFSRSHKKCIFVLKTESRCLLNIISRNISVDTAPISIVLVGALYPSFTFSVQSFPSPPWPHDFITAPAKRFALPKPVPCVSSDTGGAEQHHAWLNLASSGSRAGIHHRALMKQSMFSVCRVCSLSLYHCQTPNHTNLKINRVNGY